MSGLEKNKSWWGRASWGYPHVYILGLMIRCEKTYQSPRLDRRDSLSWRLQRNGAQDFYAW